VFADFYGTFATVSLTVTGLWMYIASSRYRDWMTDRDHVHRASSISVQLAVPGLMCLFALIDAESSLLWRVAFGVTSVAAVALLVSLRRVSRGPWPRANAVGNWVAVVIFAAIALVALAPEVVNDMMSAGSRRVEFFLFSVLLMNGLVVAWVMLFEETPAGGD
jgi:hypothetical protein